MVMNFKKSMLIYKTDLFRSNGNSNKIIFQLNTTIDW